MAGEIIFYGATVERSDDEGATWVEIPAVVSVTLPEEDVDYQEVTSLDSPNGYREYIAGLKDAGEATMEQRYTRPAMAQLDADKGIVMDYRITFASPDGGATTGDTLEFEGIRTGSPVTSDIGAPVGINNTLRISGEPVWTTGS